MLLYFIAAVVVFVAVVVTVVVVVVEEIAPALLRLLSLIQRGAAYARNIEWQNSGRPSRNLQTKFTATIEYTRLIELEEHEMKLITCVHCSDAHEICCLI